jgi:hypothetical protein
VIFIAGAGAVFRFLCILPLTLRLQNRLPKQVRRRCVRRLPLKCRTCEGEKFERCGYVGAVSAKRLGADLEDAINDSVWPAHLDQSWTGEAAVAVPAVPPETPREYPPLTRQCG